jgi:hypothetical protein
MSRRASARLDPSELIEIAEVLDHPPSDAPAARQSPIAPNLAILPAKRMAQVHAPSEQTKGRQEIPEVDATRSNSLQTTSNYLI